MNLFSKSELGYKRPTTYEHGNFKDATVLVTLYQYSNDLWVLFFFVVVALCHYVHCDWLLTVFESAQCVSAIALESPCAPIV